MTDKARLANPNAIIKTVILSDLEKEPKINITYSDGKKVHIRAGDKTIEHVLTIVNKHMRKLQEDEDFTT
ncbi:19547_t:CDS:2 [Dentiscutata erythropus]|uniref:19547_t:CDS:1 n=1 Tax=Dentiscutata erythropus TaxID=1348616 RepID=A0A9N9FBM5_9GLOM|nr:19547_t:CDS:2 [Dentiscutata erythropus]